MHFSNIVLGLASMASLVSAAAAPSLAETGLEERTWGTKSAAFSCPGKMGYCPWTKACSCAPGQSYDSKVGACVGTVIKGCWPKPKADLYGNVNVKLGAYCASSPYKIVKYDAGHSYCQATLGNVAFLAPLSIDAELKLYAGAAIDVKGNAGVSVALKNTCAGLAGLYLESAVDAVRLFNTNSFGLAVRPSGVIGGVAAHILAKVKGISCFLGFGNCNYDCVSYCAKGCRNYIDVRGKVGGYFSGLIGFCVLPDFVLIANAGGKIVSHGIDGMLCLVGNIIKSVLSTFDCGCH